MTTILFALALIGAGVAALLVDRAGGGGVRDPRPSTYNGDPRGLLALYRYLEHRGAEVGRIDDDFVARAGTAGVLVLTAPTTRTLLPEEVAAAIDVADRGGALVVLAPDDQGIERHQPGLADRLGIQEERRKGDVPVEQLAGRDPSDIVLLIQSDGILEGGYLFHGKIRRRLVVEDGVALAQTGDGPVLVKKFIGGGVLYVFSTPSLLENHRLDLAHNLVLAEGLHEMGALTAGPILFDEVHHRAPTRFETGSILGHPATKGAVLQLCVAAVVLLFAVGRRFGPIRALVVDRRRSSLEYVETLAALYQRAGAEASLGDEVYTDLRHRLFARYGISTALDDHDTARRLQGRAGLEPGAYEEAIRTIRKRPADLSAAVRAAADLDARLEGRKVA